MSPTSHPIATAAAAGDDEALASLVHAYHERVHRFGVRVCRDAFDAEDAVQEAFVKLSQRPDVVRDQGALSWLMTVVRNACIRMLWPFRRERVRLSAPRESRDEPAPELANDGVDPETALARWELVRAVHAAIAELEAAHREVLVLRDLEGLSGEETAAALGLELNAMKTRLHRARGALRATLLARGVTVGDSGR